MESHMQYLITALKCDIKVVQKRAIKCTYWALIQNENQMKLSWELKNQLVSVVSGLVKSEDKSINSTSKDILRYLQD